MTNRIVALILLLGITLLACAFIQVLVEETSPSPSTPAQVTSSQADPPSPVPSPVNSSPTTPATEAPAPTPQPSLAPTESGLSVKDWDETGLREAIQELVASPYWPTLELPEPLAGQWQAFAEGQGELSASDRQVLEDFLIQWQQLNRLAQNQQVPAEANIGFRVKEIEEAQGQKRLVLYAIDEAALEQDGVENLFLIARNAAGEAVALLLAPPFEGLSQEVSPDGGYVHYINDKGEVMLVADARALDDQVRSEKQLKEALNEFYSLNDENRKASLYPRYRFPMEGTQAVFYAIDQSITYKQVMLLRDALDLFDRPGFEALKNELFGDQAAYIVTEGIGGGIAGLTYIGTGVVILDRRDLFGNKYYLASVIAHEGSHVLQGALHGDPGCDIILAREVGEGKIPGDFYSWTADDLLKNLKLRKAGSYHVSLWVLQKLGIKETAWLVEAIQTGKVGGESIVNCQ